MRKRRGFGLLSAMIVLMVLAGFLGLMADTAQLQYARQKTQTAADAAAIAALREYRAGNTAEMLRAARGDAARNGMKDGESGVVVRVQSPPETGAFAGNTNAVEVLINQESPTLFMGIFGRMSSNVGARAVAIADESGRTILGE